MSKFTDFIDDLKKLEKKFLEIDQYESPQNTLEGFSYGLALKRGVNELFNNTLKNLNGFEDKFKFLCNLYFDNKNKDEMKSFFKNLNLDKYFKLTDQDFNFANRINEMIDDGGKFSNILMEVYSFLNDMFNLNDAKNIENLNKVIKLGFDNVKSKYFNHENTKQEKKITGLVEKLSENFEKTFSIEGLEKIAPSKDVYKSVFTESDIESYPVSKKIAELITTNPQEKDILEKANKLLSTCPQENFKEISDVSEEAGRVSNDIYKKITLDNIKDKTIFKYANSPNDSSIKLEVDALKDNQNKIKEIIETNEKINDDVKKEIKEICKIISDNNLYIEKKIDVNSKKPIDNQYEIQHSAFFPIQNARNDLLEAINKNDINKIKECTTKLENYHNIYTDLLDRCRKIGNNSLIISNISPSRGGNLTGKMMVDVIGNSRLAMAFCYEYISRHFGISIDEMLENPIEALKKGNERLMFGDQSISKQIAKENNNDICKIIGSLANPDLTKQQELESKGSLQLSTLANGIESIVLCNHSKDSSKLSTAYNIFKQCFAEETYKICSGQSFYNSMKNDSSKEFIKNLLVAKKEDLNIAKLDPNIDKIIDPNTLKPFDKFNVSKYLEKNGNFHEILFKMLDLKNEMGKNLGNIPNTAKDAISDVCNEIISCKKEKSVILSKAINKILNNQPLKNTEIDSLKAEEKFNSLTNGGIDKANLVETIKVYADLKRKYESRNFFAKIFYSNVKNQAKLVQSMEEKIIASGFGKQALDSAINSYYAENIVEFENIVTIHSENIKSNDSRKLLETDFEDNILGDNIQLENDGEEFKVNEYERDKSI